MEKEGSEACSSCGFALELHYDNVVAWNAWQMCNQAGRSSTGSLRIEAIIATIHELDGTQLDIQKVLKLDKIYIRNRQQESNGT